MVVNKQYFTDKQTEYAAPLKKTLNLVHYIAIKRKTQGL
jgi:hypothetical protein